MDDKSLPEYWKTKQFKAAMQAFLISQTWDKNLPMVYQSSNGFIVKHYKDGRIEDLSGLPILACSHKVRYATEKDATFSLNTIQEKSTRKVKPVRVYHCECGAWHLTSKPGVADTTKIESNKVNLEVPLLKALIAELTATIDELKVKNSILEKRTNKEENIKVKADQRVIDQQNRINKLNTELKRIRRESQDFMNKVYTGKVDLNAKRLYDHSEPKEEETK